MAVNLQTQGCVMGRNGLWEEHSTPQDHEISCGLPDKTISEAFKPLDAKYVSVDTSL